MSEVIFCTTNDKSVGLYSYVVDDIYHSTYGAYSESYEKFIVASSFLDYIKTHEKVSILDICYGIGYNTKTALDEIMKSDNIIEAKIDALEMDSNLVSISPLIKHQNINNEINKFIIEGTNYKCDMTLPDILLYFYQTRGLPHISWTNIALLSRLKHQGGMLDTLADNLKGFLHNIYYNYIPLSMKKGQKAHKLAKTFLQFHYGDARKSVLTLSEKYNFIFLDAFTPKKLPTLWTLEFFKELYRLLDDNGVLATYSSSAAVRSAMREVGFFVGRSIGADKKIIGTIATKNKDLIKYELDDYDKALLDTKAGIFYRDKTLNASAIEIIKIREEETVNSNKMTSSRLKKLWNKTTI